MPRLKEVDVNKLCGLEEEQDTKLAGSGKRLSREEDEESRVPEKSKEDKLKEL